MISRTEAIARQRLEVTCVHEGRISGLLPAKGAGFMLVDDGGDPIGDRVAMPSYDYVLGQGMLSAGEPGAHVFGGLGLVRVSWFEPIAITNDEGRRIGVFYIESFDDQPVRVFQVMEPKEGKVGPTFPHVIPLMAYSMKNAPKALQKRFKESDLFKDLRRARGRDIRELFTDRGVHDSPIRSRWSERGRLIFDFPGFKVNEEKLTPVLWKLKRNGVNEASVSLVRKAVEMNNLT